MLGVAAWEYAPFAILNFTVPVIALILAATGIGIEKITDEEKDSFIKKYYSDDKDEISAESV